jgi:hypothetical protein
MVRVFECSDEAKNIGCDNPLPIHPLRCRRHCLAELMHSFAVSWLLRLVGHLALSVFRRPVP